jgi:hypothetical protein
VNECAPRTKISIEQLWLLLPMFLITYKGFIFPLPQLDFWWHLKMGEVIGTTGTIPRADSFSFTATGQPFVLQNWLGELIYYATYRIGGFPLLVFLGTILTLSAFLLMYRLCREATENSRVVALVGFLAALGNYGFLRPQTYSFLLFAGFYFILVRYRERRRDQLWLLPLLMVLWVNLHGAFVLGLGLTLLYLACEACRRFIDPQRLDALTVSGIRKLAGVFILCGLATFSNPEGLGIYDYVRTVILDPGSQRLVAEWRPPQVNDFLGFLLFYCPFLLAVFTFIHARVKPDLTEVTLFAVFAILGLTAIRNAAWFSTITYPLLARYLPLLDLGPLRPLRRYRAVDKLLAPAVVDGPNDGTTFARLNVAVVVVATIVLATQSPWLRPRFTAKSLLAEQTPVGVAEFIHREGLTGRMFHPQGFGDYLMWRLWPQQKTFVDGRVHLFSLDFLEEYELAIRDPLSTDLVGRWDIQYILLSKVPGQSSPEAIDTMQASSEWSRMYEDGVSVLYEKTKPTGPADSEARP